MVDGDARDRGALRVRGGYGDDPADGARAIECHRRLRLARFRARLAPGCPTVSERRAELDRRGGGGPLALAHRGDWDRGIRSTDRRGHRAVAEWAPRTAGDRHERRTARASFL